jgi:hypothetical protein
MNTRLRNEIRPQKCSPRASRGIGELRDDIDDAGRNDG